MTYSAGRRKYSLADGARAHLRICTATSLNSMTLDHIRNFSIIAHIDHGKSTLADRLARIHRRGERRGKRPTQILDSMDLERERGITIKASPVCLRYRAKDGQEYKLNLIDTPGHVDFTYEVSRSLAACEGAAARRRRGPGRRGADRRQRSHGARSQSGNPAGHQQDRSARAPSRSACRTEIEDVIGIDASNAILASAKEGIGTEEILEGIVQSLSTADGRPDATARAHSIID